jgi:hypothetical protein
MPLRRHDISPYATPCHAIDAFQMMPTLPPLAVDAPPADADTLPRVVC